MDVPLLKATIPNRKKLFSSFSDIFHKGILAEGEYVYEFERKFSNMFNIDNVLAVSSGTAAIHMALLLIGVKSEDEIISTAMTAEPTNTAILQAGALPIFADVSPLTGNLDPSSVENSITKKTKAIIVVHYAGYPAKIREIVKIANKHKIPVIEDCAHALGAKIQNRSVGSFGDFSIFSFQAIKHITTIDGGMLGMKNKKHMARAKKMRWFGLTKGKPRHLNRIRELGFKYNMTNMAAAIGLLQLDDFKKNLEKYIKNGELFIDQLSASKIVTPSTIDIDEFPSYWFFTGLAEHSSEIINKLNLSNIGASKVHLPNNRHPIFYKSVRNPLPNTEAFYKKLIHLPTGWWVSQTQIKKIIRIIEKL